MFNDSQSACAAMSVNHVAISVSDLERSKTWYRDIFGFRVIQESPESVLLGFGDSMLVLRPDPAPGRVSHFMIGVENFDATLLEARLASRGLSPRRDLESFHVRDPDGLDIQIGDRRLGLDSGIVENGFRVEP